MKRVTYISNFSSEMSFKDIEEIGEVSSRNNARDELTGSLLCFRQIFYQILEGPVDKVDACLQRIKKDKRHQDIFVLKLEDQITERKYPEWNMRTVILDEKNDALVRPMRSMLDALQQNHRVLEKFAPVPVIKGLQAGENPLSWDFRNVEKVVLFSDLLASSTIAEVLSLNEFADQLSIYYEIFINAITNSGGTVAKLTGDGLMAYYDIDHADQALQGSLVALEKLRQFRLKHSDPVSANLYAGVGISAGPVITGNIGSLHKRDYTLLGDPVNTAARLEGITRKIGYSLIVDEAMRNMLAEDTRAQLARVGLYQPRGKNQKLEIYTVDKELTRFDRKPAEIKMMIRGAYKKVI